MRDEHEVTLATQARASNHRRHDINDDRRTCDEYRRTQGIPRFERCVDVQGKPYRKRPTVEASALYASTRECTSYAGQPTGVKNKTVKGLISKRCEHLEHFQHALMRGFSLGLQRVNGAITASCRKT